MFRQIRASSAMIRALLWSIVIKRELSWKAKLSIYRSIFFPTVTYGQEIWELTKRTRSRIQVTERGFLQTVARLSLRDGVRSFAIQRELRIQPSH